MDLKQSSERLAVIEVNDNPSIDAGVEDAYLGEDLNLGRTAKRLYCHPKTVRYRLDRARDLTGRDLTSQRDCFDIQLALRMMGALDIGLPATTARSTP